MSEKLRRDINTADRPVFERRIFIQLPNENEHKDHAIGEVSQSLQFLILYLLFFFMKRIETY